jgi:hypothetical protein
VGRRGETLRPHVADLVQSASCREENAMMHDLSGGGMMWGMALFGLLALIVAVLAIAALVKYVFFR